MQTERRDLIITEKTIFEDGCTKYEIICHCDKAFYNKKSDVLSGKTKSCGCLNTKTAYIRETELMGDLYPFYLLWKHFRKTAKDRGISYEITPEDLKFVYQKQNGRCLYTGDILPLPKIQIRDINSSSRIISVDRIDSSLPYAKDNISFVTVGVNYMKGSLMPDEFIKRCRIVARNFGA